MRRRIIVSGLADRLPSNVMISKWLPQQDALAHPNVKLFVSHVGQSSFQESICHKMPIVLRNPKLIS